MLARRQVLENAQLNPNRFPHAGLWLDKYLPEQTEQGGENVYTPHFSTVTTISVAPSYRNFFARWEQALKEADARTARATTLGRLVVGLGADSVLENAITLHRTYGVPVIPGSALKGLAAAYTRNRLQDEAWLVKRDKKSKIIYMGEAYRILFGNTDSAGYVTFFDALYVPGSASGDKPLALDVVTVHHPEYYRGENSPPADWDSPNPVPFVSVRSGVKFLVALAGPEEWVEAAFKILGLALIEEGIGAKTNSGYGRMELEKEETTPPSTLDPGVEFRNKLMLTEDIRSTFVAFYNEWMALEVPDDMKRDLARLLLSKVEAVNLPKNWKKKVKKGKTREKALRNLERYAVLKAVAEGGVEA